MSNADVYRHHADALGRDLYRAQDELIKLRAENESLKGKMQFYADLTDERLRAENERLRSALIEIEKQYANQDMNHVDFRVMAKRLADEALET